MYFLLAFVLCLFQTITVSLAGKSTSTNPRRTLDETTDPDHGRIVDTSRAVLKLDCPGCSSDNEPSDDTATALIYDLQLSNTTNSPSIHLNSGPFFPAGHPLGFTPFTRHLALPVPHDTSIDAYLTSPTEYNTTDMAAVIMDEGVPNEHGWNITRIQCIGYGLLGEDFDNPDANAVSIVDLYLLTPNNNTQEVEIVWWEIQSVVGNTPHKRPAPTVPKRLEEKLSGQHEGHGTRRRSLGLSTTLLIVAVVICVVTGSAAWVSTRYRHEHQKGIYREIASDEPVLEDDEEGDRELRQFRKSRRVLRA